MVIQHLSGTQLYQIQLALPWMLLLQAPKSTFLCVGRASRVRQHVFCHMDAKHLAKRWGSFFPSHISRCTRLQSCCRQFRVSPCNADRWQTGTFLPSASWRYFCPTNFRYSSIALVASVFSLKIKTSCSPQRSTSDITKSVKKSWRKRSNGKRLF